MATVILRNLGGSVVMAVPKKILSLVDLRAGSQVELSVEKGNVIVAPKKRPHYTLSELLKGARKPDLLNRKRDGVWLSGSAAGKERI